MVCKFSLFFFKNCIGQDEDNDPSSDHHQGHYEGHQLLLLLKVNRL